MTDEEIHEVMQEAALDALMFGVGWIKVYAENGVVKVKHVDTEKVIQND